jgi:hypothetical protein
MWLPEGLCRSKDYSTTARRCATGILDRIQTDLLLQSRLDQRPTVYVRVLHGAAFCGTRVVAPEFLHQDLHDLEVCFVGFIINACVEA